MKHRNVVSNFLFREDADTKVVLVALFKRSTHPNVRSYQEKYSPIAGSIEETDPEPIAGARREIQEETQLIAGRDIELEFCGLPFSFEDAAAGRSWTVYPYGWSLKTNDDSIVLDWEHSSWNWFDPQIILNGSMNDQCVPRISNSLKRLYLGPNGIFPGGGQLISRNNTAGDIFLKTLRKLKTDTENGARVLATEALQGLLGILQSFAESPLDNANSSEYWLALRIVAYHLIYSSRPSMNAAIRATVLAALSSLSSQMDAKVIYLRQAVTTLEAIVAEREQTLDSLAEAFEDHIKSLEDLSSKRLKIITLSASSSVLAALKRLSISNFGSDITLSITILESRPKCEGARVAADLISFIEDTLPSISDEIATPKVEVTIMPDTHFTLTFAENVESDVPIPTIVLLGTDHITPSGHIVNKTGSNALAHLASLHLPRNTSRTIVLGETDKIAIPHSSSFWSYFWALANDEDVAGDGAGASDGGTDKKKLLEKLSKAELRVRPHEEHDAKELYAAWDEHTRNILVPYIEKQTQSRTKITVENIYFEYVQAELIDEYITENGKLTVEEIMKFSVESFRLEERMFKNLYD